MKTVILTWPTENRKDPNAERADHYRIGLGTMEADVPLDKKTHTFTGVEPGTYTAHVAIVDAAGVELAPPIVSENNIVPEDATMPVPIALVATVQ